MNEKTIVCAICSSESVKRVKVMLDTHYSHIPITLQAVETYRCNECGEEFLTPSQAREISKKVKAAARERLGLLPPEQIVAIRKKLDLSQERLEALLGLGPKVVTRWENDRVLQTRGTDDLLRLMEQVPAVVGVLRELRAGSATSPFA